MTGLWQVSGRIDLSFDDLVRLDFYYIENWSIWLDISILARTAPGRPGPARRLLARGAANRADTPVRHTEAVPGAPKILAVASATDLDFRYGCTPAWWQIWKGCNEVGVDLIVTPYRGRADRVALVADRAQPALPRGGARSPARAASPPG